MPNQLTKMARELLSIEADLPFRFNYDGSVRPQIDDFDVYLFEQTWGSTALGFGGIGGQAMTSARTYVFIPQDIEKQMCHVYFGSGFAYSVPYCEALWNDVKANRMEPCSRCGKYKR